MKKHQIAIVVLIIILALSISGCERRVIGNPYATYSTSTDSSSTEDNLKTITAIRLKLKISSLISDGLISSDIDVGNTKYQITKMEENNNTYTVYGNGYFYDSYGKLCEATSKSTSSYSFTFYITGDSNAKTNCVVNYE